MNIAEVEVQIKRIGQRTFQTELGDALELRLREVTLTGIKTVLEQALQEELTLELGFDPYTRVPTGRKPATQHRSGFFTRQTDTTYGHIPDLRVPKLRAGNPQRLWQILVRYQSPLQSLLDKALYCYTLGLSLRDLQEMLYLFLGHVLSCSAVNRVTLAAQTPMEQWREQPLTETPPILITDGVWVSIQYPTGETFTDRSGHQRHKVRHQERVILAALGVWPDGRHYVLHYEVATTERAETWKEFWQHLLARQLDPALVRMVVSDGSNGLLDSLKTALPSAKLQRCTVHKVRGFERYLTYANLPTQDAQTGQALTPEVARQQRRQTMKTEALEIFEADTRADAETRLAAFVAKWEVLEAKAVHNFCWGIQRCFTFYQFEKSVHPLIRSSNLLERFFREFRNKSDEIGVFPNEPSCLTLFYLVLIREHAKHDRVDFAKTKRH
jgi:transposase-like protein